MLLNILQFLTMVKSDDISEQPSISIIGAGWLGLPLGNTLADAGHTVFGTNQSGTINSEKKPPNFEIFKLSIPNHLNDLIKIDLNASNSTNFLTNINTRAWAADTYIITLPFRRYFDPPEIFLHQINLCLQLIKIYSKKLKTIIFTSSTALYPESKTPWKESVSFNSDINPATTSDKQYSRAQTLLKTEALISEFAASNRCSAYILRLAGLFGPNRMPHRFAGNTTREICGNHPVNLVHLDDCIQAIKACIKQKHIPGVTKTYNIVSDEHPLKKDFYSQVAKIANASPPLFASKSSPGKIIDNSLSKEELGLTYTPLYEACSKDYPY